MSNPEGVGKAGGAQDPQQVKVLFECGADGGISSTSDYLVAALVDYRATARTSMGGIARKIGEIIIATLFAACAVGVVFIVDTFVELLWAGCVGPVFDTLLVLFYDDYFMQSPVFKSKHSAKIISWTVPRYTQAIDYGFCHSYPLAGRPMLVTYAGQLLIMIFYSLIAVWRICAIAKRDTTHVCTLMPQYTPKKAGPVAVMKSEYRCPGCDSVWWRQIAGINSGPLTAVLPARLATRWCEIKRNLTLNTDPKNVILQHSIVENEINHCDMYTPAQKATLRCTTTGAYKYIVAFILGLHAVPTTGHLLERGNKWIIVADEPVVVSCEPVKAAPAVEKPAEVVQGPAMSDAMRADLLAGPVAEMTAHDQYHQAIMPILAQYSAAGPNALERLNRAQNLVNEVMPEVIGHDMEFLPQVLPPKDSARLREDQLPLGAEALVGAAYRGKMGEEVSFVHPKAEHISSMMGLAMAFDKNGAYCPEDAPVQRTAFLPRLDPKDTKVRMYLPGPAAVAVSLAKRFSGAKDWRAASEYLRVMYLTHVRACYRFLINLHFDEFKVAIEAQTIQSIRPGSWSQAKFDGVIAKMRLERGTRAEAVVPSGNPFVKREGVNAVGKEKPRVVVNKHPETTIVDSPVIGALEHVLVANYSAGMIKGRGKDAAMSDIAENLRHFMAPNPANPQFAASVIEENDYGSFDSTQGSVIRLETEFLKYLYDYCYHASGSSFSAFITSVVSPERFAARMKDRERAANWWKVDMYNVSTEEKAIASVFITLCRESGDRGTSILNQLTNWIWEAWITCPTPVGSVLNFISLFTSMSVVHGGGMRVPTRMVTLLTRGNVARLTRTVRWKEGDDDIGLVWPDGLDYAAMRQGKQDEARRIGADLKTISVDLAHDGPQLCTFCGIDFIIDARDIVNIHPSLTRNVEASILRTCFTKQPTREWHANTALTLATRGYMFRGVPELSDAFFRAATYHANRAPMYTVTEDNLRTSNYRWSVGDAQYNNNFGVSAAVDDLALRAQMTPPMGNTALLPLLTYDMWFNTQWSGWL